MASSLGPLLVPVSVVQLLVAPVVVREAPKADEDATRHGARAAAVVRSAGTAAEPTGDDANGAGVDVSSLDTPMPARWMSPLRRCGRRGARWFCDGPRRIPAAHGEDARRAEALGLGTFRAAGQLMSQPPDPAWVAAVGAEPSDTLEWPVEGGHFGRGFGFVRRQAIHHIRHDGVDVSAPAGAKVRAVADGIVAYADNALRGYGNVVILVHADGSSSLYAHLRAAYVFAGQRLKRGQTLGEVGTTGLARGPHLHFEWRVNGRPRDPARRFAGPIPRAHHARAEADLHGSTES